MEPNIRGVGEREKPKKGGGRWTEGDGARKASYRIRLVKVGTRENKGLIWKNQHSSGNSGKDVLLGHIVLRSAAAGKLVQCIPASLSSLPAAAKPPGTLLSSWAKVTKTRLL